MFEFDGILDCDDLGAARLIDRVDHVVERRRFAHAGWTGNENQPARQVSKIIDHIRKSEFFRGSNL